MGGAAALVAGLVYLNALHNPFMYDDYHTVVANPSILNVANLQAIVLYDMTRPIVNFSYAIDRALWGAAPIGFHVTNTLLHMLNVVLLFLLARRLVEDFAAVRLKPDTTYDSNDSDDSDDSEHMTGTNGFPGDRADAVAFGAAVLFAVHPMMTEAVGYISGRSEVLCATFFLIGLLSGRRWLRGDGVAWAWLTIGCWLGTLATKELGAMFPFVLLAYDWLAEVRLKPDTTSPVVSAFRRTVDDSIAFRRRILTIHLPLIAIALAGGIVRLAVLALIEYPGQVSVHGSYLLLGLDVIRRYVWLLLLPSGQTVFHAVAAVDSVFVPRAWLSFAAIGLMLALAWRVRRVQGLTSLGIVWFLLLLLPSTALIALDRGEPMAEHRVYLASCGAFLALGAAIGWLAQWLAGQSAWLRLLSRAAFAIVMLSFGVQTVLRNAVWSDPVGLWRESVNLAPTHYRPRLLLGEALADEGRRSEAIEEFETAVRLRPTDPTGHVKLGESLADMGNLEAARRHFLEALRVDPQNASARAALTVLEKMPFRPQSDGPRR